MSCCFRKCHLAGAAFDVCGEPAHSNVLFNAPTIAIHLGASTKEAQENVALQIAEQISNF